MSKELTSDEKLWAMLAHLSGLLGYVVGLGQYVAPLVIYLIYKDRSKFVAFHALQQLFLQLALLVIGVVLVVLVVVTFGIGAILVVPIAIAGPVLVLVYIIVGAIKANNGELFEYWLVGPMARNTVGI